MSGGLVALCLVTWLLASKPSALVAEDTWPAAAAVLETRCVSCHNDTDRKGGFSLERPSSFAKGGDSGEAVTPGNPAASLLLDLVQGEKPEMPQAGPPLQPDEVSAIHNWIAAGAPWPEQARLRDRHVADTNWWSLQPLERPRLPVLDESIRSQARTAVDFFILARQVEKRLELSPEADRRTLIRRLYYDLTGLPPSSDDVRQFLSDPDPLAYEKLVEHLLASPRYGERWGRHWLDVVHYGDTHGYDKDKPRPNAWPYRDYVLRAWNEGKPYTRFVQEQLAGDFLWPDTLDGHVATGFISAGPWDFIGHAEVPETKIDGKVARHLDRDDMVATTMNTFLSLTVQCAQCHNHKFDPVTQEHYYSLQAVFAALDRADRVVDLDPDIGGKRQELTKRQGELKKELDELQKQVATEKGTDVAKQLDEIKTTLGEVQSQLNMLPPPTIVYCGCVHTGSGTFVGTGASGGQPREIRILARGDVQNPGDPVGPGAVPIVPSVPWRFDLPSGHPEGARRVALAQWITRLDNPLTWRSIVNRIWQYHFGRGIVDSPNDFGRMGQLPSHPELLDWLAVEFRDGGQSFKDLHRLIVCSATYRQSSGAESSDGLESAATTQFARGMEIDAENQFLWRMNRRKLEAEAIRDAVLLVAGRLKLSMGGPGFQDFVIERPEHSPHYEYHKYDPNDERSHRRSVYRFLVRSQPQPFMNTLDCADPSQLVDKRNETLTALQALALLNNRFMLRMGEHFAEHVAGAESDLASQIAEAYWLALGRAPSVAESAEMTMFAREHGLTNACRVILNLNEFSFVD